MIHLGIIEDEPIMLASVEECFEASRDVNVELAATSVEEFLESIPSDSPLNTLLLDIMLPGMNGIVGIPRLLDMFPELDIIMLTNSDDSDNIFRALQAGAFGYISKKRMNPNIIRDAVYTQVLPVKLLPSTTNNAAKAVIQKPSLRPVNWTSSRASSTTSATAK
jgi:DNA-binding NarL/FixJ family response regulator